MDRGEDSTACVPAKGEGPAAGRPRSWRRGRRMLAGCAAGLTAVALVLALDGGAAAGLVTVRRAGTGTSGDPVPVAEVTALLGRMSRATADRDVDAFLQVFTRTDAALRARWRARFTALGRLPIKARWTLHSGRGIAVRASSRVAPAGALVVGVDLAYTLHDFDQEWSVGEPWPDSETHEPFALTVARVRGTLLVTGDDDPSRPAAIRHGVRALPWASGGARAVTSGDVLVVGDVAAERMARLAARVRGLLPDVTRVWTLQRPPEAPDLYWNGRVVVEAVADRAFQAEWFGHPTGTHGSRVISYPGRESDGTAISPDLDFAGAAPRLLVSTGLLAQLDARDAATRAAVDAELRFQLTRLGRWRHDMSGGVLPAWMDSGAGDYTAYRGRGARVAAPAAAAAYRLSPATVQAIRAGTWVPVLARDPAAIRDGRGRAAALRDAAFLTCLYIADRFGDAKLRTVLQRTADQGGQDAAVSEQGGLRAVLQTDRSHLTAAVAAWARRALRPVPVSAGATPVRPDVVTDRPNRFSPAGASPS